MTARWLGWRLQGLALAWLACASACGQRDDGPGAPDAALEVSHPDAGMPADAAAPVDASTMPDAAPDSPARPAPLAWPDGCGVDGGDGVGGDGLGFELVWRRETPLATFSSPRLVDLNGDHVADVVVGHGLEGTASTPGQGYVQAYDGVDGEVLWTAVADDELVGSAALVHLDGDDVPDIVIGGRNTTLLSVSGATGERIWRFDASEQPEPETWFNFYTPQPLADLTGDGVAELLVANGGDASLLAFEPRPPGHLLVMDGATGTVLARAKTPDLAETYMSPYVVDGGGPDATILLGTGGETFAGSLYRASVQDVLDGDLSAAVELLGPASFKGVIAPPALADLHGGGALDVVVSTFDGRLSAVGLAQAKPRWSWSTEAEAETPGTPAIGDFDGDGVLDAFGTFSVGRWPSYDHLELVLLSGETGDPLWQASDTHTMASSTLSLDLSGDGLSDFLFTTFNLAGDDGEIMVLMGGDSPVLTSLHTFVGLAVSTPAIADLDCDGDLDMIWVRTDEVNGTRVSIVERRRLHVPTPARVPWGAYLGTHYDGHYAQSAR